MTVLKLFQKTLPILRQISDSALCAALRSVASGFPQAERRMPEKLLSAEPHSRSSNRIHASQKPKLLAASSGLAGILLLTNLLKPIRDTAIQRFLDGDMAHRGFGTCTVPVLLAR